jgi:hypothetical protein
MALFRTSSTACNRRTLWIGATLLLAGGLLTGWAHSPLPGTRSAAAIALDGPIIEPEEGGHTDVIYITDPENGSVLAIDVTDPNAIGGTFTRWECKDNIPCPTGFKRLPNSNFDGCTVTPSGICRGRCSWCNPSPNRGRFCVYSGSLNDQCFVGTGTGSMVTCGLIVQFDCTGTLPPTPPTPAPPNGCYCDSGTAVMTPKNCLLKECV